MSPVTTSLHSLDVRLGYNWDPVHILYGLRSIPNSTFSFNTTEVESTVIVTLTVLKFVLYLYPL